MSQSPLYHRITQKILVIGPSGCGKTNLITSILSRTNCPYQYHCQQQQQSMNGRNGDCGVNCEKHNETTTTTADTNNIIKQCYYSQTVQFREIEIQLKVFERTCNGQLDRSTIQPYYHRLDAIIGVYDLLNYQQSFNQMRMALDSILALYNNDNGNGNQRPTVFVLGNVGDNYRRCRQYRNPYDEVKEYVNRIGAIQLFNYCYSTQHIKAFHHVFMGCFAYHGNSFIYDERSISKLVDNFDFKRIPQSSSTNAQSSLSSSTTLYPKSINDKIKSVVNLVASPSTEQSSSSTVDDDDQPFYQKVIPKLTRIIFNTKPSILNNDETTIVQYRSPIMQQQQQKPASDYQPPPPPPTVPTIRLNHRTSPISYPHHHHRSSPSTIAKRMIKPKSIQLLTNLPPSSQQQWKPLKPSTTIKSKHPNHKQQLSIQTPTTKTTTQSPRETYMTLSFEEPKTNLSNEPRYHPASRLQQQQQRNGRNVKEPLPSLMNKRNVQQQQQQRQQGRRSTTTTIPNSSKVRSYHQQSY
ncbi:hypothetical protein DERP_009813, partial [Dermatophagoides pteronyssinus]